MSGRPKSMVDGCGVMCGLMDGGSNEKRDAGAGRDFDLPVTGQFWPESFNKQIFERSTQSRGNGSHKPSTIVMQERYKGPHSCREEANAIYFEPT